MYFFEAGASSEQLLFSEKITFLGTGVLKKQVTSKKVNFSDSSASPSL